MKIRNIQSKETKTHCREMVAMFEKTPTRVYVNTCIAIIFALSTILFAALRITYQDVISFNCSVFQSKDSTFVKFYANTNELSRLKNAHSATITVNTESANNQTEMINFQNIRTSELNEDNRLESFRTYPIISSGNYVLEIGTISTKIRKQNNLRYGQIKFKIADKSLITNILNGKH